METLKKKLNSSRGASILMALLFLLVCMMVGASVLMAAASNAGKIRSNREEQQKYLTLSSALTIICDELEGVEYRGRYQYQKKEWTHEETYADGTKDSWSWNEHIYTRLEGSVRAKGTNYAAATEWTLKELLPLYKNLDAVFADGDNFEVSMGQRNPVDQYTYDPKKPASPPEKLYTLEFTVDAGTVDYGGLTEPVKIVVSVGDDGAIVLTACLANHPDYIMEAALTANDRLEDLLVLDCPAADGVYETRPVRWTLDYIVKKGAGG